MEEKKNEVHGRKTSRRFGIGHFGASNYKVIFYSFLAIFAFGIVSNSIGYYLGIGYNVGLLAAAFLLFVLIARMKFANRYVYYCVFNLSLSILAGAAFFVLREKIQDYVIIFIILTTVYIFVALALAEKGATVKKEEKIDSIKELIEVCLRSEEFSLILILSFWLWDLVCRHRG